VRLGSSAVILSRAFHQRAKDLEDLQAKVNLPHELAKLGAAQARLARRSPFEVEHDRLRFRRRVQEVANGMARAA
jgi:hypothetical protein